MRMLQEFLILRVDFGPIPFPWEKVYKDQYVSKLYVDEMAVLVLKAAKSDAHGVMNLFAQDGELMATASQSVIMRMMD